MKIEISDKKPTDYKEYWPGQYKIFSHYEYVAGVPSILFMITTLKDNGKPNACFHAWSSFSGDEGGYFAIMPGLMQHTHTYKNILRDKEFCINFLSPEYYDACGETIKQNGEEVDELAAAGFTAEPAKLIKSPRIREAFMVYECTLESHTDLSGAGVGAMIIGRVKHAAVEEQHLNVDDICGEKSFMLNIHSPKDPQTGVGATSAIAALQIVRKMDE
jgi:flavin reductase (DIM6/NTAB) family NADH-FMN oxidoreductase RutF